MIIIKNIKKTFDGKKYVLDDISLSIEENSIVCLAGLSGSGKSTLLRCIQGLEKHEAGSITCDQRLGFIFQDFNLFPHLTVIENVMYAATINKNNEEKVALERKALMLLKSLNIEDKADVYIQQLSGGQIQRIAITRCLMLDPQVILCDEPTSGLDIITIDDVVTLFKSIKTINNSITMIITSHDLDFISKIADRIIVLKEGKISFDCDTFDKQTIISEIKKYY